MDPQEFITSVTIIIKETLSEFLVGGIQYLQIDDWYKMQQFVDIETYEDMISPALCSIYDGVISDSEVERNFAS